MASARAAAVPGWLSPHGPEDGAGTWVWAQVFDPSQASARSYTELLPYLLPAPDQLEAGSCLYMSHTGNVEWWLNRLQGNRNPVPNGSTDLSERFTMNLSRSSLATKIQNPLTDSIELFNLNGGQSILNQAYPFTKGWVKKVDGRYQKAQPGETGAKYSTTYNWLDERALVTQSPILLPRFEREVLFKDPDDNRWALNTMPSDIVETVKKKLRQRKAPVLVVYNHYLTWHAVMIVGYDDLADSNGCQFTNGFVDYMKERAAEAVQDGQEAKAKSYIKKGEQIQQAQDREGGCEKRGVFLVRDSIYEWKDGPLYDYDSSKVGEEAPYSVTVVQKEYQWLKRFGNHAVQIYVPEAE